jgi:hypothetical protein
VPTTLSDWQTITDFVTGLAFLGTGGGAGTLEDGLTLLRPVVDRGTSITLVSPDEVPDDTWTCAIASWGGRDPDTPPSAQELAQYGLVSERYTLVERMAEAAKELAEYRGVRLGALVSMELGASASIGTILTGLAIGIPALDSDYVGRAIPEAGQSKMDLAGFPPMPMAFVDRWGNRSLVKSAVSALMADRLARQISVAGYGKGVGGAAYLAQIRDAKKGLVRGSLLRAIEVGRALREGVGYQAHRRAGPVRGRGSLHGVGERRGVRLPEVHVPPARHRRVRRRVGARVGEERAPHRVARRHRRRDEPGHHHAHGQPFEPPALDARRRHAGPRRDRVRDEGARSGLAHAGRDRAARATALRVRHRFRPGRGTVAAAVLGRTSAGGRGARTTTIDPGDSS